jgi:hypothetical protein
MRETQGRCVGRFASLGLSRPRVVAQARLFVFLTLLVPFFGVLRGVIADGVPAVEVRVVPREVTVDVPVEVVVERIVDRLVFVPVPTATLHPWTQSLRGLFGWDLSRLPQPGVASVPAFRPSSDRASVVARPDAAVAAGIVAPGAPFPPVGPIGQVGLTPGAPFGPNPFPPSAPLVSSGDVSQLSLAAVLSAPMVPLTASVSPPEIGSAPPGANPTEDASATERPSATEDASNPAPVAEAPIESPAAEPTPEEVVVASAPASAGSAELR